MTTKTIPEYLEDGRREDTDTQRRKEEEAARNLALHHGEHRNPKPPLAELPTTIEAVVNARKTSVAKTRKTVSAKKRKPAAASGKKPPPCEDGNESPEAGVTMVRPTETANRVYIASWRRSLIPNLSHSAAAAQRARHEKAGAGVATALQIEDPRSSAGVWFREIWPD